MPVKVSVIVPVFNPGEGIKKCIRSLVTQTLRDLEIIFVDDCGTDQAMAYISKAARKDERIKILKNPQNMGSGQSRNKGIKKATGEYLSFIDPDDYVFPDFLELLYKKGKATKADIVKGVLRSSSLKKGREKVGPPSTLNLRIQKGLDQGKPLYSLFFYEHTTAIYRRETVLKAQAYYGLSSNAEDLVFQLRICYRDKHVEFENKAVYVYVERNDSNNRKVSINRLNGEVQSVREMMSFLEEHNADIYESGEYLSRFVTKILEVQKVVSKDKDLQAEAGDIQNELKLMLTGTKLLPGLKQANMIVSAFIDYDINLAVLPYSRYWYQGSYAEYKKQIEEWVDFLCIHPEYCGSCQPTLWRVFESAIVFDDWHNETGIRRKKALREIRRQAFRLPDRKILTDNYISMRMFIDYGINTFGLRDSGAGNMVKRMAIILRK